MNRQREKTRGVISQTRDSKRRPRFNYIDNMASVVQQNKIVRQKDCQRMNRLRLQDPLAFVHAMDAASKHSSKMAKCIASRGYTQA